MHTYLIGGGGLTEQTYCTEHDPLSLNISTAWGQGSWSSSSHRFQSSSSASVGTTVCSFLVIINPQLHLTSCCSVVISTFRQQPLQRYLLSSFTCNVKREFRSLFISQRQTVILRQPTSGMEAPPPQTSLNWTTEGESQKWWSSRRALQARYVTRCTFMYKAIHLCTENWSGKGVGDGGGWGGVSEMVVKQEGATGRIRNTL